MTAKRTETVQKKAFDKLPKEISKDLTYLQKEARDKELKQFIPLINEYLDIRNRVESLEVSKDEKGNITKESIKEYKEVKKDLRSFNASMKSTIDDIKKPYWDINKKFVAVKKTFEENKKSFEEHCDVVFKDYVEEQQRKKEERERKKREALEAEINEKKEEAEKATQKANEISIFNNLKYDRIMKEADDLGSKVENLNVQALKSLKDEIINEPSLSLWTTNRNLVNEFFSLTSEHQEDLIEVYDNTHKKKIEIVEKAIENAHKKLEEEIARQTPVVDEEVVHTSVKPRNEKEFCNKIVSDCKQMLFDIEEVLNHSPNPIVDLQVLKGMLIPIANYKLTNDGNND